MKIISGIILGLYICLQIIFPIYPCYAKIEDKTQKQYSKEIKENPELSVTISSFENKLYGQSTYDKSLSERVSKLEKDVFKTSYNNDDMSIRINRISQKLFPEEKQNTSISQNKDNYSNEVYDQSGGKISIFGKMPIVVFFDNEKPNYYDSYFEKSAKDGFEEWQKAMDDKIKFEYTNSPSQADIIVEWKDFDSDFKWVNGFEKQDINAEKERMKYRKAGVITRISAVGAMVLGAMVGVPALGYLGSIGGSVASPIFDYKGMNPNSLTKKITIGTSHLKGISQNESSSKIKRAAMHQMGHAMGIYGHSSNKNDIMNSSYSVNKISDRDINTLKFLYNSSRKE